MHNLTEIRINARVMNRVTVHVRRRWNVYLYRVVSVARCLCKLKWKRNGKMEICLSLWSNNKWCVLRVYIDTPFELYGFYTVLSIDRDRSILKGMIIVFFRIEWFFLKTLKRNIVSSDRYNLVILNVVEIRTLVSWLQIEFEDRFPAVWTACPIRQYNRVWAVVQVS